MITNFISKNSVNKINLDTSQAQIHNLSRTWVDGQTLSEANRLFYRINGSNHFGKLDDSLTGMMPSAAWKKSYGASTRTADGDIVLGDIFVYDVSDRPPIGTEDADNAMRGYINSCRESGSITFCANVPKGEYKKSWNTATQKYNGEALVNFNPTTDTNTLTKLISQWLGYSNHFECKKSIDWNYSYQQHDDVVGLTSMFGRAKVALYAAYTSRGKTLISLATFAKMYPNGGIALVTTPETSTLASFRKTAREFYLSDNRDQLVTVLDSTSFRNSMADGGIESLRKRATRGELIIILLSVQDLRWDDTERDESGQKIGKEVTQLRDAYSMLTGNLDMWIRDEYHKEYGGVETSKRLRHLESTNYLDLTATPYQILHHYKLDNVLARTLLWGLKHAALNRLPRILIDGISESMISLGGKLAEMYDRTEGWDARKSVAMMNGQFELAQEWVKLRDLWYRDSRSKSKNPLSISNDTSLSAMSKRCGMIVLPPGKNDNGASVYLPLLASLMNTGLDENNDLLFIDADLLEKMATSNNLTIGEQVETLLQTGKRVIILTCGKFLTGTDIKPLGHIILMKKMENISNFEQLVGRMIRPWENNGQKKDSVKLYNIQPNQELMLTYAEWAKSSANIAGQSVYEYYECVPLSMYDMVDKKNIRPSMEKILEVFQDESKTMANRRLPGESLRRELERVNVSISDDVQSVINKLSESAKSRERIGDDSDAKAGKKKKTDVGNTGARTFHQKQVDDQLKKLVEYSSYIATMFAVNYDNYNVDEVYQFPEMDNILSKPAMDSIRDIISQNIQIRDMLQKHLSEKAIAYKGLTFDQFHDLVFTSDEFLKKQDLVFISNVAAEYFCTTLNIPKNFSGSIVVGNALSGSVPFHLKKLFPRAIIYCREYFPYFKGHLERMGFTVITTDEEILEMAMTEKAKGKPFDYGFINPPYMKGKWKKFITDLHSRVEFQLVTISPDPTEGIGKDTEDWIKKSESMGIQSRIDATQYFPTVQSGKISLCSYQVGSAHNPIALTRTNQLEASIIKRLTTEDNGRICVRGSYEFMTPKVKGVKRNRNNDILPNSDLVTSTMTQAVVVSVGKTKLDQRFFEHSVKNPSTIKGDGFVFNRSFGVDDDSPVYKVSNSNSLGFTNNVLWHDAKIGETVESFKSVFGSKLYRYFFKKVKNGALDVQARLFTSLRCPELAKVYTDAELYELNGITDQSMIDEIEANYE